jgi:hypothetical protein
MMRGVTMAPSASAATRAPDQTTARARRTPAATSAPAPTTTSGPTTAWAPTRAPGPTRTGGRSSALASTAADGSTPVAGPGGGEVAARDEGVERHAGGQPGDVALADDAALGAVVGQADHERRLEHLDAGEHVGPGPEQPAHRPAVVGRVDGAPALRVGVRTDDQGRGRARFSVRAQHRAQIEVEDDLAVQDHERLGAEERQRAPDAAAGAEDGRLARVGDRDPELGAGAELVGDELAVVVQVDDQLADAVAGAQRDRVADERDVGDRHERLGPLVAERAQTRAEAGGEDHRARHASGLSSTTKARPERAPALRS